MANSPNNDNPALSFVINSNTMLGEIFYAADLR